MTEEYNQGYASRFARDNPYWTNYPDKVNDAEVVQARKWVDGWCQRAREEFQVRQNNQYETRD